MAKKVYFAFHYQDVVDFRANVIRKHNFTKGVEGAGYYDYSIWEESRKNGDAALKRMIHAELEGTSVTVVLIGSNTYERPWVRYEIVKSIERSNRVFGIHINSIAGKDQKTKIQGPNPFDYLGLLTSNDGLQLTPTEWKDEAWRTYVRHDPWTVSAQPSTNRGKNIQLSHWFRVYDWVLDNGYSNFNSWVE